MCCESDDARLSSSPGPTRSWYVASSRSAWAKRASRTPASECERLRIAYRWRNAPAHTSSSPTASSTNSQMSSAWWSRGTIPLSIAYLTTSGAATAPVCQSRPESTAPETPCRCARTTARTNLHAAGRRASRSPMALTYPRMRKPIEQRFPRPSVMGVVNVTPDSFSDAGVNFDPDDAVASARRMLAEGAAIVDVGGESTRPGAQAVSVDEELRRVLPVLEQLSGAPVSIDTSKAEVARRALALGAELVNDVTALRGDPALAEVVARSDAYLCLMHMQADPRYDDVVSEVAAFLEERLRAAVAAGIAEERICLDPGIGFGKTVEHNFELVRRLGELTALGRPVVVGFSRKSSLGKLLGDPQATTGSVAASVGAAVAAYERGATILRVHDVREHVEALTAAQAALA